MTQEGLLDALGGWSADAMIDGECLPHVGGALAGVAVMEVAVADSFQGACFLQRRADLTSEASAWL